MRPLSACARPALAVLVALLMLASADRASAAIALVHAGTLTTQQQIYTTTVTIPSTTAGDLLVATVQDFNSNCATNTYSAPTGWVKAASVCRTGDASPTEIWYYPEIPAGITSVVFTNSLNGASTGVQVSEWSGVDTSSPLDQTGTASTTTPSTTLTVTTTGTVAVSGELAITLFGTAQGLTSFTPGSGWTSHLTDETAAVESDYKIGPTSGAKASESMTSNPQTGYSGVIVTFEPACSGGSLTVTPPATVSFTGSLNGANTSTTSSLTVTVDDETGTGSGWNLEGTSTTLTNGTHTLPTTATTITSGSPTADSGNCSLPANSINFPVTLPAAATAPTAVKLIDAAASTGAGPSDITLGAKVSVPPNAYAGTYTSTWTLTVASGP
jgi:hypothetical protein